MLKVHTLLRGTLKLQAVHVHCNKHGVKCCCGDAEFRVGEESSTDQAPLSADGHKKKRRIAFSVAEKAMLVKRSLAWS